MPTTNGTTALKAMTLDHPMNRPTTVEMVDVTPALAQEWLGHNLDNRNLRPVIIAAYARDMTAGAWVATGDSLKFDWNGRLIDGQHRLSAVISANRTIRFAVARNVIPTAQKVLDVNARRSSADALRFDGVRSNATVIAGAANIARQRERGFIKSAAVNPSGPSMTNSEVVAWVQENPSIVNAAAFAGRIYRKLGATPAVLTYCVWVLEEIDPFAAMEFFNSIAEQRTAGLGDPRLALAQAFTKLRDDRTRMGAGIQIFYVFRAWNAWRNNETLSRYISRKPDGRGGYKAALIPEPVVNE
ncbi:hypothetical protein EDF22_0605 [Rathayibacter sp. PhB127]|uniref:hypothetical protein n=1 Tax=Rathayibacter sp. PhB127 TaxID=2485176 RepID=UPI000F4BB018|nr:hypothetical protein [Rathayibacter sp. PhB127]ROS28874.1 hypothetical protein EDF22_0605 [Rathayibacter sp. PhB127]